MNHVTEPSMMVLCSDMIELTENHEIVAEHMRAMSEFDDDEKYAEYRDKFANLKDRADKNLRKYNRRTLSN